MLTDQGFKLLIETGSTLVHVTQSANIIATHKDKEMMEDFEQALVLFKSKIKQKYILYTVNKTEIYFIYCQQNSILL